MFQWQIQDVPEGEVPTPTVGVLTYHFAICCRKLNEKENSGPRGGCAPPLGSANVFLFGSLMSQGTCTWNVVYLARMKIVTLLSPFFASKRVGKCDNKVSKWFGVLWHFSSLHALKMLQHFCCDICCDICCKIWSIYLSSVSHGLSILMMRRDGQNRKIIRKMCI